MSSSVAATAARASNRTRAAASRRSRALPAWGGGLDQARVPAGAIQSIHLLTPRNPLYRATEVMTSPGDTRPPRYERIGRAAMRKPAARIPAWRNAHLTGRWVAPARSSMSAPEPGPDEPRDRYVVPIEPSDVMAAQRPPELTPAIRAGAERSRSATRASMRRWRSSACTTAARTRRAARGKCGGTSVRDGPPRPPRRASPRESRPAGPAGPPARSPGGGRRPPCGRPPRLPRLPRRP